MVKSESRLIWGEIELIYNYYISKFCRIFFKTIIEFSDENCIKNFDEFKAKKHVLYESKIRDFYDGWFNNTGSATYIRRSS